MYISIKEKYADFINKQLENKADYLPTFKQWMERRRILENRKKEWAFAYDTKDFGRITIKSQGIDVYEGRINADAALAAMQRKYDDQKGNKGALTERELIMKQLEKQRKELKREVEEAERLEKRAVAIAQ